MEEQRWIVQKNVGSSSRKYPFRTEKNLSICLTPTEIRLLITRFRTRVWLILTPIGRDVDICLKALNWGRGDKKPSGVWIDQTRNQTCTQSLPNVPGRPTREKKNWKETARSSGDTSEGQKYKLSLIPATKYGNDKCLGCSSTARK